MDMEKMKNEIPNKMMDALLEMLMDAAIESAGENDKALLQSVRACKKLNRLEGKILERAKADKAVEGEITREKGDAWRSMLCSIEACINILETAMEECRIGTMRDDVD